MGRPRKHQQLPLKSEASGNWFRWWLEEALTCAPGDLGALRWEQGSKPPPAIVDFLVERTNVDQRQLRGYLSCVKTGSNRLDSKTNPQINTAIEIARGIRDLSPYASPLCMMYNVTRFRPHAWGVIGHLCAPGPTAEIMKIWPAIRWMVDPTTPKEKAHEILVDDTFNAAFDRAWGAWSEGNSTSGFPKALSDAIDHARNSPIETWGLSDAPLEAWVGSVTRNSSLFGRGMRPLDGRSLCARELFEREIKRWELENVFNEDAILTNRMYILSLTDEEQWRLMSRVKAIFVSRDSWRQYASLFESTEN